MSNLIKFVHEEPHQIISEMKVQLEQTLNRQIAPADVEMLLINSFAYRETILRAGINSTARQNLVAFANGIALDYLGELVGVNRLPASAAACTLRLSIILGHSGIILPAGLRVQSIDGKATFATIEQKVVPPGQTSIDVKVYSVVAGTQANDFEPGKINVILDPQPYLESGANIDITTGGANDESDDELRDRIRLAPSKFSVAGPTEAYKYFAKSASSAIVDVAVTSPTPGQVNIYPLLQNGTAPTQAILDLVQSVCNADKVRPLTDTVVTLPPEIMQYQIIAELTIITNAVNTDADAKVKQRLQEWTTSRENRLGMDVILNRIRSIIMADDVVYNVDLIQPTANIVASPEVYTKCTAITVTIIGTHDE